MNQGTLVCSFAREVPDVDDSVWKTGACLVLRVRRVRASGASGLFRLLGVTVTRRAFARTAFMTMQIGRRDEGRVTALIQAQFISESPILPLAREPISRQLLGAPDSGHQALFCGH